MCRYSFRPTKPVLSCEIILSPKEDSNVFLNLDSAFGMTLNICLPFSEFSHISCHFTNPDFFAAAFTSHGEWEHYQFSPLYNGIPVLCKLNNTVVTIWWVPNIKYTCTGSLKLFIWHMYMYSIFSQIWQMDTLIYKKDNCVTVLIRSKIAITSCIVVFWELVRTRVWKTKGRLLIRSFESDW